MADDSWMARALQAVAPPPVEPEPLSAENIALSDWAARRGELGLPSTSDFVGVRAWQRPTRYVHHEVSELEKYAQERAQLGVKDVDGSVVPGAGRSASQLRTNASPWRAV